MKMIILLLLLLNSIFCQEVIEISVKGISDGTKDDPQKDRLEAILDAKRQACEKAGISIRSETTVENFQTVYDMVETKAESVLLPGFQIIDIGYVQDGSYQVVLSGKIQIIEKTESISAKQLRYAQTLKNQGNHAQCRSILEKYINNEDPDIPESVKEEALYLFIKWGYSYNMDMDVQKFSAFYPQSQKINTLQRFAEFSAKPVYAHEVTYEPDDDDWKEGTFARNTHSFDQQITVLKDTVVIRDFKNSTHELYLDYRLFKTNKDVSENCAYLFQLSLLKNADKNTHPETIMDRFKTFRRDGSPTFQHSSSGTWFEPFQLKFFQIKGQVPSGNGKYSQEISFEIYQRAF